jgi:hypothetical protein
LPKRPEVYLEPLIERAQAGVAAVAKAVEAGELRVDDELHLTPLAGFSWLMLGREPRSEKELLMVYAGILAHGTSMSAAETARMMPLLSAASVRQADRTDLERRALELRNLTEHRWRLPSGGFLSDDATRGGTRRFDHGHGCQQG